MTDFKLGIYEHYKGNIYQLVAVAKHSETEELFAVYHPIDKPTSMWVRPLIMFNEVVVQNGVKMPRFQWLREA